MEISMLSTVSLVLWITTNPKIHWWNISVSFPYFSKVSFALSVFRGVTVTKHMIFKSQVLLPLWRFIVFSFSSLLPTHYYLSGNMPENQLRWFLSISDNNPYLSKEWPLSSQNTHLCQTIENYALVHFQS